jgi:hypothetical protein
MFQVVSSAVIRMTTGMRPSIPATGGSVFSASHRVIIDQPGFENQNVLFAPSRIDIIGGKIIERSAN